MEMTQNSAAAIGVIGDAGEGKPLPTALFGFRKRDVLAAIDGLMKANAEQQQALGEQLAGLRQELQAAQDDKALVLEKTRELCEKLSAQEEAARRLEQDVAAAKKEGETFKVKLFSSEKENYALRQEAAERAAQLEQLHTENERLSGRIGELELSLDGWKAREAEIGRAEARAREDAARLQQEAGEEPRRGQRPRPAGTRTRSSPTAPTAPPSICRRMQRRRHCGGARPQCWAPGRWIRTSSSCAASWRRWSARWTRRMPPSRRPPSAFKGAVADVGAQTEQVGGAAARLGGPEQAAESAQPSVAEPRPQEAPGPHRARPTPPHIAEPKARSLSDLVLEKLAHILS